MKTIQTLIADHLDIWTAAETEKKSGRGRSSGNAASVYGIKKLRELILELAVRGKLVPQDANFSQSICRGDFNRPGRMNSTLQSLRILGRYLHHILSFVVR